MVCGETLLAQCQHNWWYNRRKVAVPEPLKLPLTVTSMVPVLPPCGDCTTNCVDIALTMFPRTPLNVTMLSAAVVLKPLPFIVTNVPASPLVGNATNGPALP